VGQGQLGHGDDRLRGDRRHLACREEISRFGSADWRQTMIRMPGEQRTRRVRPAAQEGQHHLGDIRRLSTAESMHL
jgi:hypothetical protein